METGIEHALFYRSENHDRVYNTNSMEYWLKKFFTTGVFTGDFQVIANGDMSVKLTGGYVNIGGKVKVYLNDQNLLLETAHATYDRIDSIVLERNDSERDFFAKVITGGYSSNPAPLVPVRENGVDQRVVAQIYVAHGAVRITQADITDTRADPELCGMVAGTVKEMDFSQFQKQFDGYFDNYKVAIAEEFQKYMEEIKRLEEAGQLSYNDMVEVLKNHTTQFTNIFIAWFEDMQGQLSEDAAGHLQLEVDKLAKQDEVDYFGLKSTKTVFNDDGSITEKIGGDMRRVTTFRKEDGITIITETITQNEAVKYVKTTTINQNEIKEETVDELGRRV